VSARYREEIWGSAVEAETPLGPIEFDLRVHGRHNIVNALGAIAGATAAGASLAAVRNGLASFHAVAGRLEAKVAHEGAAIIDDTYNANPDSVRAAIAVLAAAGGRRWLVLGDMGEVGEKGSAFHREIGECARAARIDRLFATGKLMSGAVAAFGAGGEHFDSVETLIQALRAALAQTGSDVTLLVKGSRFMRMERVVGALTGSAGGGH
jgi:UDP-N-acetylmuramoyl-tripeptide--D-alanyl-D-alanine ligase